MLLSLLSVLVGVVAGFGAVVFRGLIGLFHNLLFLGRFSFAYNANVHTPASPWGRWSFWCRCWARRVWHLSLRILPQRLGATAFRR
jgi:hypothetical protein